MKKAYLLGLSLVVIGLLSGCGDSDSGSGSGEGGSSVIGGATSSTKVITTVEDAKQAAAAFTQINSLGAFGSGFANTSSGPSRAASLAPLNHKQDCPYGGTMTTSGSYSDDGSDIDMTQSYNNCSQGSGMEFDGSMRIQQETSGNDISMRLDADNLRYQYGGASYYMDFSMDIDTNTYYNPTDMRLDGTISMSDSGYDFEAEYDNFRVRTEDNYLNISGTVSMESDVYSCFDGTYTIKTLSDLYMSGSGYSSGTMIVNGATYSYSGSSVEITLPNGDTSTVSQSELANSCN